MSDLRIGVFDLEPKDVAYIRALVRLFAQTEKLGWSYAEHPPYHAVVADASARIAHPAFFDSFKGLVATMVTGPGVLDMNMLAYPIRANQFRDWLKLRQSELMPALYQADDSAGASAQLAGRRFKLRRWPASGLLLNEPMRLRIATLMSRNAMSSQQLAELTGQPEGACRQFLGVLHAADLLIEMKPVDASGAAPAQHVAGNTNADADGAEVEVKLGLMASIRRRFGL